jgi:hypothetical protein
VRCALLPEDASETVQALTVIPFGSIFAARIRDIKHA